MATTSDGPSPQRSSRDDVMLITWMTLVALIYALVISWLDPALPWPAVLDHSEPWYVAALNTLPPLLLCVLLMAITRRPILASWLGLLAIAALYAVNGIKVRELDVPLLPDDFRFLRDSLASVAVLGRYVHTGIGGWTLGLTVCAITALLVWRETPLRAWGAWQRAGILGAVALAFVSLCQGNVVWSRLYDAGRLQFEPWSAVDSAKRAGIIGNLVLFSRELADSELPRPDRTASSRLLRDHAPALRVSTASTPIDSEATDAFPDIVIVQSESAFDPARLVGIEAGEHLVAFHRLAQLGLSGQLRVPTFGGGTIRTEFEMLTGLSLEFFPRVRFPYFEMTRPEMPGLVRALRKHGYATTAIHPNAGAFWNRNQAYRSLGFEHFIDGREFPDETRASWFASDAALTDRILGELADDGPPQLLFAVSIQNHGPHERRPNLDEARMASYSVPAGLDAAADRSLRTYLVLLEDADRQLERLARVLLTRERRTLLLFYGDHLPALPLVFSQMAFADGRAAKDQPVPWLLLDNAAVGAKVHDTSAWLLPAILLASTGVRDDRYFTTLNVLREALDLGLQPIETDAASGLAALGQLRYRDELDAELDAAK